MADGRRIRTLRGEELRAEIDATLAELDRLEADVTGFFGQTVGPEAARAYQEALLGRTFEAMDRTAELRPRTT